MSGERINDRQLKIRNGRKLMPQLSRKIKLVKSKEMFDFDIC